MNEPSAPPTPPPATPGRPSAVQPQKRLERRVPPLFAVMFYGFLALAGWVWLLGNSKVNPKDYFAFRNPWLEIGLGFGAAVVLVGACATVPSWWRPARELEREFGWILGEQRKWEVVILAVASGTSEELFFRGSLDAAVGPVIATAIFAILHWPVSKSFVIWPFFAVAAGAVFTMQRHVTGGLIAPMITHVLVNLVNLWAITSKYRVWSD